NAASISVPSALSANPARERADRSLLSLETVRKHLDAKVDGQRQRIAEGKGEMKSLTMPQQNDVERDDRVAGSREADRQRDPFRDGSYQFDSRNQPRENNLDRPLDVRVADILDY